MSTRQAPRFCECGEPIMGRSDAEFCSNACRQRAYRRRRAILQRYGSWENALTELSAEMAKRVTDNSRNAEGDK